MRAWICLTAAAVALAGCGQQAGGGGAASGGAAPRQQVWAAGSSTVFPFATRVAETVARTTGGQPAKVESLGTGGGFKLFCAGTGPAYPDIADASRPIKKSEFETCAKNGVNDIVEIKIGFDGIVIANALNGASYDLTEEEIFKALAADLPTGDGFARTRTRLGPTSTRACPANASRSTARRRPPAPATPSLNWAWKAAP